MNIVDDRVLVLGLDELYRKQMARQEPRVLLPAARRVAKRLGLKPFLEVTEGYYGDTKELQEYFCLVRNLQEANESGIPRVRDMVEYRLIEEVCTSRLYGYRAKARGILHVGRDSLTEALERAAEAGHSLDVRGLVEAAGKIAVAEDDYSLVGLACLTKDPVCITVARESAVLYAEMAVLGAASGGYEWAVSSKMQESASRFVAEFQRLFGVELPQIKPENAGLYYSACMDNYISRRCVRIGENAQTTPPMYYYWAIDPVDQEHYEVFDFWSSELWTSERYKRQWRQLR